MKTVKAILILFLLADLSFSFYQHYHMPVGGDMAEIVIPSPGKEYDRVLHDPLGLDALLHREKYANPNRFFAHWTTSSYFKTIPPFLQNFVSPIESIYLSIAIAKILIQLLIIYLIAAAVSNSLDPSKTRFILAAALITPFFQTFGYHSQMGIIDQSVVYSFFYALPLGLTILFFLPFFRSRYYGKNYHLSVFEQVVLVLLSLFLVLNGPLGPGVILIICFLTLIYLFKSNFGQSDHGALWLRIRKTISSIPKSILFHFILISIFCLYSLYLGRYNSLESGRELSFVSIYSRLFTGLYYLLTQKLAFGLLIAAIISNLILIKKWQSSEESHKILVLAGLAGLFIVLYILLLPLGGFRIYRPNFVRHDTILPVTLALIFLFSMTSLNLIHAVKGKIRVVYVSIIIILLTVYTINDKTEPENYYCERASLNKIANSAGQIIDLASDCPVMDWVIYTEYDQSELNAKLLQLWNVTDRKRLYRHVPN